MRLVALARERSGSDRFALAKAISGIYADHAARLNEREAGLIGEILDQLVRAFELDLRRDMAERLARLPAVPREVILFLVNDEIEVAAPLLRESPLLDEADLLALIRGRGPDHQRAIAQRQPLETPLCEALVEAGDVIVVETMLRNPGARLSEALMTHLVEEARWVDSYREPLVHRAELTESLAERLYLLVSRSLRQELLRRFDIDGDLLDKDRNGTTEASRRAGGSVDLGPRVPGSLSEDLPRLPGRDPAAGAEAEERRQAQRARVTAERLIGLLRAGDSAGFQSLLAGLSRLEPARLAFLLERPSGHAFARLCRALGIAKADFAVLLFLTRRLRIGNEVEDPRDVARLMGFYEALETRDALASLGQWQTASDYRAAIEAADSPESGGAAGTRH